MLDILIINGKYPDFEKDGLKEANIGILNGEITYIGKDILPAVEVIDAKDRVVSPGFIDIHMHEEDFAGEGEKYQIAEMMLKQGVTTCVGGNCGVMHQSVAEFRQTIERLGGSPVNYVMLSGYNSYRNKLLGIGHYEAANEEQRLAIRAKIKEDLAAGAFGISFGIEYDPGITLDEILFATHASEDSNLLVAAHYRDECADNIASIEEMVSIQDSIDKKFQISHLVSCSALGKMKESLDCINEAMERNPRLNYDTYPYNAFCTMIGSTVFEDGCLEAWHKDYSDIMLTDEPYKNVFCDEEIFRHAREEYPDMLAVAFVMNEEEVAMAIANKNGMVASDGIINHGGGHPRAAGTFPRVLGKYVREEGRLSLVKALKKMSFEQAKRLGMEGKKGCISLGAHGDITIFDPKTIADGPDFQDISKPNIGIDWVIVKGKIALKQNRILNDRAGKFIPYGSI